MPNSSITDRLSSLPNLRKPALLTLWQQLFKTDPPDRRRKELMLQFLAYRIQEEEFGELSDKSHRCLEGSRNLRIVTQIAMRLSPEPGSYDSGKIKFTL